MSMIDTSQMDADESIAYCTAKSLWPDDEASFELEWLRVLHERELKQKQQIKEHSS